MIIQEFCKDDAAARTTIRDLMCEHSVSLIWQVVCKSMPPITLFRAQIDVSIFPPLLCLFEMHECMSIVFACIAKL